MESRKTGQKTCDTVPLTKFSNGMDHHEIIFANRYKVKENLACHIDSEKNIFPKHKTVSEQVYFIEKTKTNRKNCAKNLKFTVIKSSLERGEF